MTADQCTKMLYRLVSRIANDPYIQDVHVRTHAHAIQLEIRAIHPNADVEFLPPTAEESKRG